MAHTKTQEEKAGALAGAAGNQVHASADHHEHDQDEGGHEHSLVERMDLLLIGFVGLCIVLSWSKVWTSYVSFDLFALVGTLIGGLPIFREAFGNLLAKRMTMELSMTIALVAALAIGEFFTAAVITVFVLVAEVLEGLTVGRGRQAIKDLLDLLPNQTFLREESGERQVKTEELEVNDVVIIKPGSLVPVDGEVVAGHSFVEQASITGESVPVEKVPGTLVYAGTINQNGVLEVRTTGVGRDTAFGKIIEAVERAEKSRAPIQKVADRLAGYLVYFAMGCAVLTYAITQDIRSTISVIIVAGACGIAAGTPLAVLGAIGLSARKGSIIKGGRYLEILGTIDTVILDKTGTLTFGDPEVIGIQPRVGVTQDDLLRAAAIAEKSSEHPLGKAVLTKAIEAGIAVSPPEHFEYTPGKGIVCALNGDEFVVGNRLLLAEKGIEAPGAETNGEGSSEILVAQNGRLLGSLKIADVLRPEAVEAVGQLRVMGIQTLLMTGDNEAIAQAIGEQLNVDAVEAQLLPEEKLARVVELTAAGKKVVMVGDGINDAPALMEASVGVAMGSGTDVARESADIVLLGDDLLRFVATVKIARRCRGIIMANFTGTLLVDSVGVGLAAFGYLNPLLAAFIHVSSELVFILNSARLIPRKVHSMASGPRMAQVKRATPPEG